MITKTYKAHFDDRFLSAYGQDPGKSVYFDIETTGLSPSSSHLYLIGAAVKERSSSEKQDSDWTIIQWFAQNKDEELKLLQKFSDFTENYDSLIHFNGSRFDIPYLKRRCEEYSLPSPLKSMKSLDLYRAIRPLKKALGLEKLNQKALEVFLGITRKDMYSGGQLIDVYRSYADTNRNDPTGREGPRNEERLSMLLLHNYEDLLGMFSLTALLAYPLMQDSNSPVCAYMAEKEGQDTAFLHVSFSLPLPVPKPLRIQTEECLLQAGEELLTLDIAVKTGTLYHFFKDYRNYFYLPAEDMAIHRSVADFVDPAFRQKAKAENCYQKKEGCFLPQPEEIFTPSFKSSCKDKQLWFECPKEAELGSELFSEYIHRLVRALLCG